MRLIDADAYLDSIKPRGISDELWKECKEYKSVMSFASAQSEVIRCKDCKYNGECSIQFVANADDKFFCGAGERRHDG